MRPGLGRWLRGCGPGPWPDTPPKGPAPSESRFPETSGPAPEAQAGFTLVETLVCLALAGLIGVLLVNAVRVAGSASAASAHAVRAEAVQSVRDHLRRTLGSLARRRSDGSRPTLQGGPEGLSAVLEPDQTLERATELAVTLTRLARADGTYDLVESRSVPDAPAGAATAMPSEVLLAGVAAVGFRYFGAASEGAPPAWYAAWARPDRQPSLIEIRIALPPSDPRRWPALLIALDGRS